MVCRSSLPTKVFSAACRLFRPIQQIDTEELRLAQQRSEMHEDLARRLAADVKKFKELLSQRDQEVVALTDQHAWTKQQVVCPSYLTMR